MIPPHVREVIQTVRALATESRVEFTSKVQLELAGLGMVRLEANLVLQGLSEASFHEEISGHLGDPVYVFLLGWTQESTTRHLRLYIKLALDEDDPEDTEDKGGETRHVLVISFHEEGRR